MTEIRVPFLGEFRHPIQRGTKRATTRNKRLGSKGDWFPAFGMKFVLTEVVQMRLGDVFLEHYKEEGFEDPESLVDVWLRIHPVRKLNLDDMVWFHRFEEMRK